MLIFDWHWRNFNHQQPNKNKTFVKNEAILILL
jgi:hypothetical protein